MRDGYKRTGQGRGRETNRRDRRWQCPETETRKRSPNQVSSFQSASAELSILFFPVLLMTTSIVLIVRCSSSSHKKLFVPTLSCCWTYKLQLSRAAMAGRPPSHCFVLIKDMPAQQIISNNSSEPAVASDLHRRRVRPCTLDPLPPSFPYSLLVHIRNEPARDLTRS